VSLIDRYRECGRPDKGSDVGSHGVAMVTGVVTVSVVIRSTGVVRVVVCYGRPAAEIYVLVYCSHTVDTLLGISIESN